MSLKFLLSVSILLSVFAVPVYAEFDAQAAFEAHRDYMVGGTWVSTDDEGELEADRHIASKSKKFVRIANVFGGTGFLGIYGIDPQSGDLTLWTFDDDDQGAIGRWICTAHEKGTWTWESEHKSGPFFGKATLKRISRDEMQLKVEGESASTKTWKRKR